MNFHSDLSDHHLVKKQCISRALGALLPPLPVASPSPQKFLSLLLTPRISFTCSWSSHKQNHTMYLHVWLFCLAAMFMRPLPHRSLSLLNVCRGANKIQLIYAFYVYRYLDVPSFDYDGCLRKWVFMCMTFCCPTICYIYT